MPIGIPSEVWGVATHQIWIENLGMGTWQYEPEHPWGPILIWLKSSESGGGYTARPESHDPEERAEALRIAHGQYHNEIDFKKNIEGGNESSISFPRWIPDRCHLLSRVSTGPEVEDLAIVSSSPKKQTVMVFKKKKVPGM